MIIRFLYNVLAFIYNHNVEREGESSAYYSSLCFLSLPLLALVPFFLYFAGYQLRSFTGTKWDALPLYVLIMGVLWLCFPKKKVIQHAQIATKKEQKVSTIIFVILMFLSLSVVMLYI